MSYHVYRVLLLVCSISFIVYSDAATGLRPGGANVLTTNHSMTAYRQVSFKQTTSGRNCWQTCGCIFCWCTNTVCRTYYYLKTAYRSVSYIKHYSVHNCTQGWQQLGSECPTAICTTVNCTNGGNCTKPNHCNCTSGWTDANCTTNVNECATNNGDCDHYCNDTIGSFNCSCDVGFTLQGKTHCQDINECITSNNTGCQQLCLNQPGTYKCGCYNGYRLNSDNKTCSDIDECSISNSTKYGCSYRCNNTIGSYECSCPSGFLLTTNRRDCADHDECMTGNNTCQQKCINHPGHYTCDCRQGYDLNERTNNTCLDIDECESGTDGCAHICNNTIGGYYCRCHTGYELANNNRSCNDINECQLGIDGCSQRCVNVIGSFYCSCRHGYYLDLDLKTCKSYPCQSIATPPYGSRSCTGFNTDDVCRFSCKTGYELLGSMVRVCMSDAQWSGQQPRCVQKQCSSLQPPSNGYVYIPCASSYDSQCVVGCESGFVLDGPSVTKCSHGEQWKPLISKCKVADLCQYKPCKNGGACLVVNATTVQCNCTNTGFKGPFCDEGQVITPKYPTLTLGNSTNVTFILSSPDKPVLFTPLSKEIVFSPSSWLIDANQTKTGKPFVNINMNISSVVLGDHLVKYSLTGQGSYVYKMPSPDVVSVVGHNSSCSSNQTIPKGCYQMEYQKCTETNASVVLYSTTTWNYIGKGIATDGIVSLNNKANILPVSTTGITLSSGKAIQGSSVASCLPDSSKTQCSLSNIFATQFLRSSGTSFPPWFSIRTTGTSSPSVQTHLWTGKQLLSVIGSDKVTIGADKLFSVLFIADETILQVRQSTLRLSQSTKSKPHVVAVELCSKTETPNIIVAFNLLSFYQIQTMDMQKTFGSVGWDMSFIYVQFSLDKTISRSESLNSQKPFVGNLEMFGGLNATLENGESIVVRGSTLFDAEIEKLTGGLPSQWQADVRGAATISTTVDYQSGPEPLIIDFSKMKSSIKHNESVAGPSNVCKLDGQTDMLIKGLLNGKSLNTSTISWYLEVTDNMEASVSINIKKYSNNNSQENDTNSTDTNDYGITGTIKKYSNNFQENDTDSKGNKDYGITGITLHMNGTSKYGPLRFPNTTIDIKINRMLRNSCKPFDGTSDSGVHMLSTANEETKLGNFVVFAPNSGHFLEVRLSPKESYGMLSAKARLFGEVIPVSIKIQNSSLRFSTIRLNVFQQFPATVNVSGQLKPWEKLSLRMRGVFDHRSGEKVSLLSAIETSTNEYIQVIVTQVGKRMAVTQKAQQLAESRANKTKHLLDVEELRLQNANGLYLDAVRNLSLSTKTYTEAKRMLYINRTREFNDTVKILENLCAVNDCPFECVPGSMCSMCNTNITGKIRNLCQGACYRSVIERTAPFGVWKSCKKHICKNVTEQRDGVQKQSSIKCGFTSGFGDFVSNLKKRSKPVKGVSPSVVPEWLSLRTKKVLKYYLAVGSMKKAEEKVDDYTLSEPSAYSNKMDSQDTMKCRRESVNYWQCRTMSSSCYTSSFKFQYKNVLYPCETSCELKTQTEHISTPCCKKTSCVTRVKNMACRKRNTFCHIIRDTAIAEKLPQAKQLLVQPYKMLLDLQKNIYKAEIEVERRKTNLQTLTTSRDVLLKSHQSTSLAAELSRKAHLKNEAKMGDALMLVKKWQSKTQANLVTVTMASFDIVKASDVSSVPVEITTSAEGVVKKFNIILKSNFSKSFLHDASRKIASSYYGKISAALRNEYKMMIQDQIQSQEANENQGLDSLINLKRKCSLSVNYERGLNEVMRSLYNVTQRILKVLTDFAKVPDNGESNEQGLPFDSDAANKLGLTSQDIDIAKKSIVKQQEIIQANSILQLINASTVSTLQGVGRLVFTDWFAVMEKLFHDSAAVCNGFTDCMQDNLDNIFYLYDNVTLHKASYMKSQISDVRQHFTAILNSFDFSAKEANNKSKSILEKLEGAKDLETFCASAPNITKQPNAINEINIGNQLTLKCLAVGVPAPSYQWKKDGKVLQGRVNSDLFMESVRNEDSGNYTCVAYNHVALIESAPSLVIVHSPPMITKQPPSRLSVTIDSDFYLECEGLSKSRPIGYQWYFKKGPNDAYNQLTGQTYPIYSVNRANNQHRGIYKCQISNKYGSIDSQDTLITVLDFELVRPGVLFTAHIRLSTVDHKRESKLGIYRVERGIQDTNSEKTVNIFLGNWICPLTSLTSDCVSETRLKRCYPDVNGAGANATICESTFVIRSTNPGSFNLSKTQAEQNADNVEDSVAQLSKAVTTLLNVTSRETHSVNIGTTKYELMKNSVSAVRFLGICDQGKQLYKNEYMCVNCPPGTFGSSMNAVVSTCTPCPLHTYQPSQSQSSCLPCPPGFTTNSTGSKDINDCKVKYSTSTPSHPGPSTQPTKPPTTGGLPTSKQFTEPTEPARNDSNTLNQKGRRSGEQSWKIAVGVSIGILFIVVVLVLGYLYLKKKRAPPKPAISISEEQDDNQQTVFDNPVFEQEKPEAKRKEGIEMSVSPLYTSFEGNHDDEVLDQTNPLYLALAGSSDA